MSPVQSKPLLVITIFIGYLIGIILFGAHGVRGTDQYQYLADTERLAAENKFTTNLFFPIKIVREAENPTPNYIAHNGPLLLIAAAVSKHFSAYNAWILINTVSHLLVAFSIYMISIKYCRQNIAVIVTSLYLCSPIALWQTMNLLQEQFFSCLVALSLLAFYHIDRAWGKPLLLVILPIGIAAHPIFIVPTLLSILFLLASYWFTTGKTRNATASTISAALLIICTTIAMAYSKDYFPSSFQPNLNAIITSAIPGQSNMMWHYSDVHYDVSAALLYLKLKVALTKHFFSIPNIPFYIYTNLAILAAFYLLVTLTRKTLLQLLPVFLYLGLYAGIIILQQNHARFQQIIAPASFLLIAFAMQRSQIYFRNTWLIFGLSISLILGTYLSWTLRSQSIDERDDLAQLKADTNHIKRPEKILAINLQPHGPLAYTLNPTNVLSIRPHLLSNETMLKAISIFSPDYLLIKTLDTKHFNVEKLDAHRLSSDFFGGDLLLYELNGHKFAVSNP